MGSLVAKVIRSLNRLDRTVDNLNGRNDILKQQLVKKYPAIIKITHPCRTLIIGRSQSGKTTLAAELFTWMSTQVDSVFLISPTWKKQPTWKSIEKYITHGYANAQQGLRAVKQDIEGKPTLRRLLIIDDCSYESILNTGNKGLISELLYNAIWYNLSVLIICHKVNNVSSSVRENLEHLILFSTVNNLELDSLMKNFSLSSNKKDFREVFSKIISEPIRTGVNLYPFIYICYKGGAKCHEGFSCELNLIKYQ